MALAASTRSVRNGRGAARAPALPLRAVQARVHGRGARLNTRCPHCGHDLASRKLARAIIARMEIDCPGCQRRLRLNLHPLETLVVLAGAGAFVARPYSPTSVRATRCCSPPSPSASRPWGAVYVVERHWLRDWPRYVARGME
jgi:hypothetical protein